jgi:hypothetical protein
MTAAQDKVRPPATITQGVAGAGPVQMGNNAFQNFVARIKTPIHNVPSHKIAIIYGETTPVGDSDYAGLPIGSIYIQLEIASSAVSGVVIWKKISATLWAEIGVDGLITDPGDAGAIPVTKSGYCPIVTAGAETRTLAIPSYLGQKIAIGMSTDAGDAVITVASAFDALGHTTITLNDAAYFCLSKPHFSWLVSIRPLILLPC